MAHLFKPSDLEDKVFRLIRAAGSSESEARTVAANLVLANLSGHDSHGIDTKIADSGASRPPIPR